MRKNNIITRALYFIMLSMITISIQAQTGLNFQGVARTSNNVILASQAITIKLSILQSSATGTTEYTETRKVITNAQGLFTAVIGDTGAISTLGNFATINWKSTPKFLKKQACGAVPEHISKTFTESLGQSASAISCIETSSNFNFSFECQRRSYIEA